jgi:DNA anti-recombination protein RmuC
LKNSTYLFIATLVSQDEEVEEEWEGKIKAINKKVDSGFSNMKKDILYKIRKEVRNENEALKKQVNSQIEGVNKRIGGMENNLKLIVELL